MIPTMIRYCPAFILFFFIHLTVGGQGNDDDYWLNNGFSSGQTIITNSGFFYDDGGFDVYQENQDWNVEFCSENGNPITLDFSGFKTHYGGTFPSNGQHVHYDYMSINYPGASYVAFHDDTPEFSFTSQSQCITFGFHSDGDGLIDSGWVAEIYAVPPPFNNDPSDAEELVVGNVCSPSFYTNKGAYNSTGLGSPPCKTYFGGDVWFTLVVPPSGVVKIETFPITLTYAILDIFSSADDVILSGERIACVDDGGVMPAITLGGPTVTAGERIYIRVFGEQAKSGLFGICATDPTAPVTGYTGPGGVGDSLSLDFWFRPDSGILNGSGLDAADGEQVSRWRDQSGNDRDLEQPVSANQPLYSEASLNNFSTVTFDGMDDLMTVETGSGDAPLYWFAVGAFNGSQRQTMFSVGDADPSKTASLSRDTDGKYFSFTDGDLSGPDLNTGEYYLFHPYHSTDNPHHFLQLNGSDQAVDPDALPLETDGSFTLGASWNGGDPLDGDVAELIQYRKSLNSAQQIIVNNYLAAKYDLALTSNDFYSFKNAFHHDVAGIGRVDADNMHTRAQSAGILSVSGADDLDDNEFLFFGHDNGDFNTWTGVNVPDSDTNIVRLERTWRVDIENGDPGALTLTIEKSSLPELPAGFAAYNIIVDSDSDFTSGSATYGPFELGSELVINNAVLSHGDYLAIAAVRPLVSFTSASGSALESIANPTINVEMNYAISSIVEIDYQVTGGTALQGTDYSLNTSSISINPGSKSNLIIPLIIDDDEVELPDEYFDVSISTSTPGVTAGGITSYRHTILNDDLGVTASGTERYTGECATSFSELTVEVEGTGPFTYEWSPATGLSETTNDTVTASPAVTTLYTVTVTDGLGNSEDDTISVYVIPAPPAPAITIDGDPAFCEGDSVKLSAPEGFSSYLWSTADTQREIWAGTSGNYTVVVTDSFGCASPASDPFTITVNPLPDPPMLNPDGPLSFCEGGSVNLVASGSYPLYTWTDNATGNPRTVSAAGEYAVKVQDNNGCESGYSDTVTVTVFTPPSTPTLTSSGPVEFCEGDSVILIAPAGFDQYTWSDGSSDDSLVVHAGGDYNVFVTDVNGCDSDVSSDVSVLVNPLPAAPVLTPGGPAEFCDGGSLEITASAGYAAYTWSTGEDGNAIVVTETGSYSVTGEDANGCVSLPSIPLDVIVNPNPPQPVITPQGEIQIITGDSVVLVSSEADGYLWSPDGQTTRQITVKETGIYSVVVENAEGCFSIPSEAVNITVNEFLPSPVVTVTGSTAFCEGESVILTGESGFTVYSWSDGSSGETIVVTEPGTYSLVVENENGISSLPSEAIEITVYDVPSLSLADLSEPLCHGDENGSISVNVAGGTAPFSFDWGAQDGDDQVSGIGAGDYTVTVSDVNSCIDTLDISLDQPDPLDLDVSETPAYCPDFSDGVLEIIASGGTPPYDLGWDDGTTGEYRSGLLPGEYTYAVTDANGCRLGGTYTLGFINDVCFTIPGIITPNDDGFNDTWRIDGLEVYPGVIIEIFDRWGRRVFYSEGHDDYFDGTHNGRELPMESYHYVIDLNNGSEKIIGNITIVRE